MAAASKTFEVKLSLRDADTVKRGLQSLGADGERALKRIETAAQPAGAGLQALDRASAGLQGQMGGLASRAGVAGDALQALGKSGLAAAAGLGAAVLVIAKVINAANEATRHFGDIADAAQRAGTSAEHLQVLQRIALQNATSTEELSRSLETLHLNISKAADGNAEMQKKFEAAGISMDRLKEIGGDTALVLSELANNGSTAAQQSELLGRTAKGMSGTMVELKGNLEETTNQLRDLGLIASNEVVKSFDELADRGVARINEEFAKWSPVLLAVAQGLEAVREEGYKLLDLVKPILSLTDAFWKLRQAVTNPEAWKDLESMRGSLRQGMGLEPTPGAPAPTTPRPTPAITISPPAPRASRGGGGSGRARAEPKIDLVFGKPFEDELARLEERSTATLTKTQEAAQETTKRIVEANLQAHNDIVALINIRRDEDLRAVDLMAANEEEKAQLRVKVNDTADTEIAKRTSKNLIEGKPGFADQLVKFGQGLTSIEGMTQGVISGIASIGSTASSAFADAIVAGEDFGTTMESLTKTIEKMLIQMTLQLMLQQALGAGAAGIGGMFGGTAAAAPTGGGMALARGGTIQSTLPQGVYDRPTLFQMQNPGFHPMARGMGLLGEAGPEAVLPLRRTPSGRLGVEGGGKQVVNIQVNNSTGAQVATEQRKGLDGSLEIVFDIFEKRLAAQAVRPGSTFNKALANAANPVRAR